MKVYLGIVELVWTVKGVGFVALPDGESLVFSLHNLRKQTGVKDVEKGDVLRFSIDPVINGRRRSAICPRVVGYSVLGDYESGPENKPTTVPSQYTEEMEAKVHTQEGNEW